MMRLADTRCFNHFGREAVARCPECGRHYCRECVTEHAGRLLCASCLAGPQVDHTRRRRLLAGLRGVAQAAMAVLLLWTAFYLVGAALLRIPAAYHEPPGFGG